jgi:predicted nucleic acid-binding protein
MVVVDSSVLIHLARIGKLTLLKKFFKKITITGNIRNEVTHGTGGSEIDSACGNWIVVVEKKYHETSQVAHSEGIEEADASIILLARGVKDILLSNDAALIAVARSKGVECWWLTTFLLRCLERKIVTKKEAKETLFGLVETGMHLNNAVFAAILKEIDGI